MPARVPAPGASEISGPENGSLRVAVVLGPSGARGADRVESPGRLLRVWAMLSEVRPELENGAATEAVVGRLGEMLNSAVAQLEQSVSPALRDELRRLVPRRTAPCGLAELRVDYVTLLGWTSGLVVGVLSQLDAASQRQSQARQPRAMPARQS